jgi:MarR family transcriptional regulator, transcriptional regulator for hemolysin
MSQLDLLPDTQYFFGALFVASNRLDTILEREFNRFGVTTKQWFLSIVIDRLFDQPPTIKQVARAMGSSHQNVKQLALKLSGKGLLRLEKDEQDTRATRLQLTEESRALWKMVRTQRDTFNERLFDGVSEEELKTVRNVMGKLLMNIETIDHREENT